MFCIDTQGTEEIPDTDGKFADDSDSDCEIPKFHLSAFQKFGSGKNVNSVTLTKESNTVFHNKRIQLSSTLNAGEGYNKVNYVNYDSKGESIQDQIKRQKEITKKELNETLKKSIVCQPGFERLEKVPTFSSRRQLKKQGLKARDKTKGFQWYNMAVPEMTEEKKNDLLVVQMRQALDPKRFYKRSATKNNPKYFQVGTFVETPVEFYSSRVPKKQRKQTLVDELLADAEFRKYQKKKFADIQKNVPSKFVKRKKVTHKQRVEARNVDTKKKTKKTKKN